MQKLLLGTRFACFLFFLCFNLRSGSRAIMAIMALDQDLFLFLIKLGLISGYSCVVFRVQSFVQLYFSNPTCRHDFRTFFLGYLPEVQGIPYSSRSRYSNLCYPHPQHRLSSVNTCVISALSRR